MLQFLSFINDSKIERKFFKVYRVYGPQIKYLTTNLLIGCSSQSINQEEYTLVTKMRIYPHSKCASNRHFKAFVHAHLTGIIRYQSMNI